MGTEDRTGREKYLARLVGPTIVALAATELLHLGTWAAEEASPASMAPLVYLNGSILFVCGLALLRAHHRWTFGWPVLLTLTGWFALGLGLARMVAPRWLQQQTSGAPLRAPLVGLLSVGLYLTFKAFSRERADGEDT